MLCDWFVHHSVGSSESLLQTEKSEINLIKFNGKNYPSWAFQFELYLEGKELWSHISGTDPKPTEDEKKIVSWNTKDGKIKTWILGSMERQFFMNLKPYKTAKDMWDYLKKVFHQGNSARQYQLEFEIANYMQGTSFKNIILVSRIYGQN